MQDPAESTLAQVGVSRLFQHGAYRVLVRGRKTKELKERHDAVVTGAIFQCGNYVSLLIEAVLTDFHME